MKKIMKYVLGVVVVAMAATACQTLAGRKFQQDGELKLNNTVLSLPATIADYDEDTFVDGETDRFIEHIRIDSSDGWTASLESVVLVPDAVNPDKLVPAVDDITGEWISELNADGQTFAPDWCYIQNPVGNGGMEFCYVIYNANYTGGLRYVKFIAVGKKTGVRKTIHITQKSL